jgi:hypothetical protein
VPYLVVLAIGNDQAISKKIFYYLFGIRRLDIFIRICLKRLRDRFWICQNHYFCVENVQHSKEVFMRHGIHEFQDLWRACYAEEAFPSPNSLEIYQNKCFL